MLIGLHIVMGVLLWAIPGFSRLCFLGMVAFFFIRIVMVPKNKKLKEVLIACVYVIASEVLFRMTFGTVFYESSKYLIILYVSIGLFSLGMSGKAYPYFIYLILLIPSILVASINLSYTANFRTNIAFVLSGPVCLGMAALFFYDKKVKLNDLLSALMWMSLPIISMTTYLFLYTPDIKDVLKGTQSNFATSGGFGPNQVASILGLGMFALAVRLFMKSPTLFLKALNVIILGAISFRAIVTFSRGGVLSALVVILAFLAIFYVNSSKRQKKRIVSSFTLFVFLGVVTWAISSSQTGGLIDKRYANQDKLGNQKEDLSTGRVDLFVDDLQGFFQNPFAGVGASGAKELRLKNNQGLKTSHNEISRLLSEHGIFAILILLILVLKPLFYRAQNKRNFFFYAFLAFWFATINHSAMRIAAPALVYALSLLNVVYEKRPVYRKLPQES
ncbi:MAG: O-antigen ligase family protein [Bacteroidota bacterium]